MLIFTGFFFFLIQIHSPLPFCAFSNKTKSSLARGVKSHKIIDEKQSSLLRIYYTSRAVLFTLCFGNEAFFLLLYLLHFWAGPSFYMPIAAKHLSLVELAIWIVAPLSFIKQFMNFVQMIQACRDIVSLDITERSKQPKKK